MVLIVWYVYNMHTFIEVTFPLLGMDRTTSSYRKSYVSILHESFCPPQTSLQDWFTSFVMKCSVLIWLSNVVYPLFFHFLFFFYPVSNREAWTKCWKIIWFGLDRDKQLYHTLQPQIWYACMAGGSQILPSLWVTQSTVIIIYVKNIQYTAR